MSAPGGINQVQGVAFGQDVLGQPVGLGHRLEGGAHVEVQVAGLVPKAEQRAQGGQPPIDATGGLALIYQLGPPVQQILQGQFPQGRGAQAGEAGRHVAAIGALRVGGGTVPQPQGDQVGVVRGAGEIGDGGKGVGLHAGGSGR